MPKFIEVHTHSDDRKFWINVDLIESFNVDINDPTKLLIFMAYTEIPYMVRETLEQLLVKLRQNDGI